jgi:hypothetical protein
MHPNRRGGGTLWSRAHSSRMHHASYPVFVHRPAVLDWASFRPRLTVTPLPFSLPSALRKPGHRTCTYEVTRHARRTRKSKGLRAFAQSLLTAGLGLWLSMSTSFVRCLCVQQRFKFLFSDWDIPANGCCDQRIEDGHKKYSGIRFFVTHSSTHH